MKFFILYFCILFTISFSSEPININFKDLKISELIKITSKLINKNILLTYDIDGKVEYIPNNNDVTKDELLNILKIVLSQKGFKLVEEKTLLRIAKIDEIEKDFLIVKLKNIKSDIAKSNVESFAKTLVDINSKSEIVSIIENNNENSLTLVGDKKSIENLKKYIDKIDEQNLENKKITKIVQLRNSDVTNVSKVLDEIISKNNFSNKFTKTSDLESNSVILIGNSSEIEFISNLLEELDKEKNQVYVQAKIIEVNDDLVNQVGLSYGVFGANMNGNVLSSFSTGLNKGEIPNFHIDGLKIPDLTSGLALGATLNLLKQNGALDVVSEPSILAINNQESSIYVGEKISIKVSSSVTNGGTLKENYEREDVGLRLKVKPRISNDVKVTLDIEAILEGIKNTKTISGNADTSKKQIKTTAILNNGESVIIGGLIENKLEKTEQKVPVLGDVPLFGELFKNSSENSKKNNLVIIVTPYLVPKSKDITYIRNKLSELKNLEDRYLENSLIKLKEEQKRKNESNN